MEVLTLQRYIQYYASLRSNVVLNLPPKVPDEISVTTALRGPNVQVIRLQMTDSQGMIEDAISKLGALHVLLYDVSTSVPTDQGHISNQAAWDQVLRNELKGAFKVRRFSNSPSRRINVGSAFKPLGKCLGNSRMAVY